MDPKDPEREITVEPLTEPVPAKEPQPEPDREKLPRRRPEKLPAGPDARLRPPVGGKRT
jgi:hypothetical protein